MTKVDEQTRFSADDPALQPLSGDPADARRSRRILLVEPDIALMNAEALFLTQAHYTVAPAYSQGDLFELRGTKAIALVILSEGLGARLLSAVARTVRRQWPLARILLLGRPDSMTEDYLYDEQAERPSGPRQLLEHIESLYSDSWNQPSNTLDWDVRRSLPWKARARIRESDPTKTLPAELAYKSSFRDMPAIIKYRSR